MTAPKSKAKASLLLNFIIKIYIFSLTLYQLCYVIIQP